MQSNPSTNYEPNKNKTKQNETKKVVLKVGRILLHLYHKDELLHSKNSDI